MSAPRNQYNRNEYKKDDNKPSDPKENQKKMKEKGAALAKLPAGYRADNSFDSSNYGRDFKEFKKNALAELDKLSKVDAALQSDFKNALTTLENELKSHYAQWVSGIEYKQDEWDNKVFQPLEEVIGKLKSAGFAAFADKQLAALNEFKKEKRETEHEFLARSLDNQYTTNASLVHSVKVARELYANNDQKEEMFVPVNSRPDLDEKKIEDEVKGTGQAALSLTTNSEDEFRKKVKRLVTANTQFFESKKYPNMTFMRLNGGWMPTPSSITSYETAQHAYRATLELARLHDPQAVFVLTANRVSDHHPIAIRTAKDVKVKVLAAMEACGHAVELDEELRAHLVFLKKNANSVLDRSLIKVIDRVFEVEQELMKAVKKHEIIGRNAEEWEQKTKDATAKLGEVPQDADKKTFADKRNELITSKLGAPDEKLIIESLAKDSVYPASVSSGTPAAKVEEIKKQLVELDKRFEDAKSVATLTEMQLTEMKKAAAAEPNAPAVRGDGHIQHLEKLCEKNTSHIEDIQIRAKVLNEALRVLDQDGGAPDVKKDMNARLTSIANLSDRNGIASKDIDTYKQERQQLEAGQSSPSPSN